jgi:hypothetical protein
MIVTLRLDTTADADRALLLHLLDRERAPVRDERGLPDEAVSSTTVVRGRDALRSIVVAYQADDGEFGEHLATVLGDRAKELEAYVGSCGGKLVTAVAAVWTDGPTSRTPEAFAEDESAASRCAGTIVTVASALGFEVPESWWRSRV